MNFKSNNNNIAFSNYIPDSEFEKDTDEQENSDENEDSDEELDDETRQMIYAKASRNINRIISDIDISNQNIKKEEKQNKEYIKKQNKLNKNSKCVMSIIDFNKKIEEKKTKIKKFTSKRVDDKKKQLGIEESIKPKRTFNPRKPPYNFVKTHDIKIINLDLANTDEFPSL